MDTHSEAHVPESVPLARATLFEPRSSRHALKRTAVRGVAATFGGQAVSFALGVGSTAVLSRLLTPEDFGLIAMTAAFTALIAVFTRAGLAAATVQRETITHEQVSTLFWVNAALGCAVALVLAALAPAVAAFYREPRLEGITYALALCFVFGGLAIQHQALMRRRMEFRRVAVITASADAAGVVTAIVMAWQGFGYWSLVGMSLATAVASALGSWVALPWRPGPPRRGVGALSMVRFGGDVLTFNLVQTLGQQAEMLLLGWRWGAAPLGWYDRAARMMLLPMRRLNAPLTSVVVPTLSRLQAEPERFARFFLRALELLAGTTVPLVAALAVFADEVVYLWLGEQWMICAHLFRLLAVAAIVGVLIGPMGWVLVARGQTRKHKWIGVFRTTIFIAACFAGLPYGVEGVAIAASTARGLLFFPLWQYALRDTPVRFGRFLRALWPPLAAAIPAGVAGYLVSEFGVHGSTAGLLSLAGAAVFAGVYALILFVGFDRWRLYRDVIGELRNNRGTGAAT